MFFCLIIIVILHRYLVDNVKFYLFIYTDTLSVSCLTNRQLGWSPDCDCYIYIYIYWLPLWPTILELWINIEYNNCRKHFLFHLENRQNSETILSLGAITAFLVCAPISEKNLKLNWDVRRWIRYRTSAPLHQSWPITREQGRFSPVFRIRRIWNIFRSLGSRSNMISSGFFCFQHY